MRYFASLRCPGLPRVTVYEAGTQLTYPPVRLSASEEHDLVALRSEVPVSPTEVADFATCITNWLEDEVGTAVYVTGFPGDVEIAGDRELYGISTGAGDRLLADHGIEPPTTDGVWSGPTGALLARAREVEIDAVGLLVETDPQFPDPEAACAFINHGVNPIVGVDVDDSGLQEHAEEIRGEKEQLAQQLGQSGDDSSRAEPTGMFQ